MQGLSARAEYFSTHSILTDFSASNTHLLCMYHLPHLVVANHMHTS